MDATRVNGTELVVDFLEYCGNTEVICGES